MINATIFSFDRAMQLHLLLESIEKNANNVFSINVLYKYSNEDFKKGYEFLKQRFSNINFLQEDANIKEQIISLMQNDIELSCFMMDNDVLFRNIKKDLFYNTLITDNNIICMNFRQGLNTSFCYSMNCDNIILPDKEDENFIYWEWKKRYTDAGCAFFLEGGIYRTKDIKKIIKSINFSNLSLLEDKFEIFSENYPREVMFSYKNSVLVGIVDDEENNKEKLNEKYLDNQIIDYNNLNFSNINSANCKLKLVFKNYE